MAKYIDLENPMVYLGGYTSDGYAVYHVPSNTPTADVVEKERYARLRENANILAEALNEYQTADFVEVVRCKDCKQYERHIKAHYKNGAEVESHECRKYKMAVTPDWFCADGERG